MDGFERMKGKVQFLQRLYSAVGLNSGLISNLAGKPHVEAESTVKDE